MKNPLKKKGFRQFVIKGVVVSILVFLTTILIERYFSETHFFKTYLFTPITFQLLPFINRIIFVNAVIFGCVVFLVLAYKKLLKLKPFGFKPNQLFLLIIPASFFALHYLFKFIINRHLEFFLQAPVFWGLIKLMINFAFVISLAVAIYGWDFTKHFIKNFKKEIVIFSIMTIAFFFIILLFQNLWKLFSDIITRLLYNSFKIFFDDVYYKPTPVIFTSNETLGPTLGINNFKAIIGKQCSGIDSFLLFTALYALIFVLDYKRLKKSLAIILFFVGAIGMFFINFLRIFLLFIVGAYISPSFAVGLFHTNAGWILFIIYFFIFWTIASRFVYKKRKKTEEEITHSITLCTH